MDKKYLANVLLYVLLGVAAVFLIIFVLYHLFDWGASPLSTRTAQRITAEETIEGEGYLFRNETMLFSDVEGQAYSSLREGEKVGKGNKVTEVFDCDKDLIKQIAAYDEAIAILEMGNGGGSLSSVEKKLKTLTSSLRQESAAGDLQRLSGQLDELQIQLNRRKTAVGALEDYTKEINALKQARAALVSRAGGAVKKIYAPFSGNFYSSYDGYEELFDSEKLLEMSIDDFSLLISADADSYADRGCPVGKMIEGAYWYLAIAAPAEKAEALVQGRSYTVVLSSSAERLTMTLDRLVSEEETGKALLVFGSRTLPATQMDRCEEIRVVTSSYSGLLVPAAALRSVKNQDGELLVGVYVKEGNRIRFKRVNILFQTHGYYLVEEMGPGAENASAFLAVNEVIVTAGKDLEEGYRE